MREFSAPVFHSWPSVLGIFRSFFHVPCINRTAIDVTCPQEEFRTDVIIFLCRFQNYAASSASLNLFFPPFLLFLGKHSFLFPFFRRVPATWLQVLYGNGGFSLEYPLTEINLNRYAARVALSTWPWLCDEGVVLVSGWVVCGILAFIN